jgi:hypothetical protein
MSRSQDSQQKRKSRKGPRALADLATKLIEPVVARRASMRIELMTNWLEIAGQPYGAVTRPERISWRRRAGQEEKFSPGSLLLACESSHAILLQHESAQIIGRINTFFGFDAVDRIRITQKPIRRLRRDAKRPPPPLNDKSRKALDRVLAGISDPELRLRLEKLGRGVYSRGQGR